MWTYGGQRQLFLYVNGEYRKIKEPLVRNITSRQAGKILNIIVIIFLMCQYFL